MARRLAPLVLVALVSAFVSVACLTPKHGHVEATAASDAPPGRVSRKVTVAQVLKSSVRILVSVKGESKRTGSGVVFSVDEGERGPVSYVVTNEHVVNAHDLDHPIYSVLQDDRDGTRVYPAHIAAEGSVPELDLAVLAVDGVALEPAKLGNDDELSLGDEVVVVGAPYGRSLSVSGGMLSRVDYERGEPRMLKTDAPIGYGASGGGIFSTETGHLLGIIEGYRTAQVQIPGGDGGDSYRFDVPMPGETFAAPLSKLRQLLSEHHLALLNPAGKVKVAKGS
jgi:S1-C subfamily serine protease